MLQSKWSSFLRMPLGTKVLFIEAFCYLGWSRFLKSLPFTRIAPTLGQQMAETSWSSRSEDEKTIRLVSRAVRTMSRYTLWESKCLVMAMAALKMLHRRGIDSTLYLGTAKDQSGQLIAHAWLRSGPFYLTGAEEMGKFTVVSKFGHFVEMQQSQRRLQNGS